MRRRLLTLCCVAAPRRDACACAAAWESAGCKCAWCTSAQNKSLLASVTARHREKALFVLDTSPQSLWSRALAAGIPAQAPYADGSSSSSSGGGFATAASAALTSAAASRLARIHAGIQLQQQSTTRPAESKSDTKAESKGGEEKKEEKKAAITARNQREQRYAALLYNVHLLRAVWTIFLLSLV